MLALLFRQTSNIIVSWNLNNNLQEIFHRLCKIKSWDKYKVFGDTCQTAIIKTRKNLLLKKGDLRSSHQRFYLDVL